MGSYCIDTILPNPVHPRSWQTKSTTATYSNCSRDLAVPASSEMPRPLLTHLLLWTLLVAGWAELQHAAAREASAVGQEDFDARGRRLWFDLRIAEATPLVADPGACSLGPRERLQLGRRLPRGGKGAARRPACLYHAVLPGHGPECLIEYPAGGAGAYSTENAGASAASRYYDRRQGGIAYLTTAPGSAEQRLFLILDDRWCRWLGAGDGFLLYP
jgi:hypothetical protein